MSLPSTITLTQPSTDSPATSADQRNDHTAIQTAVNGLIAYLTTFVGGGAGITGLINANGTIAAGSGFTCAHTATGHYTITFTAPFAAIPTVLVTSTTGSFSSDSWSTLPALGTVDVFSQTGGIGPVDQAFNFYAVPTA